MAHIELSGLGVALVTPFTAEGEIDFDALERLVDYQLDNGTDFLVVLGTTAETPTLSAAERHKVMDCVKRRVAGKIPLVVGYGGNNTAELCEALKSDDLSGYSAILSVVPFYNKPIQEGIYRHFMAVADASPLPIILYNVPGRTGANMTPATTLRLANSSPKFIAVKEACGNVGTIAEIIEEAPAGFTVLSGDDGITFPLMQLGAKGIISVVGNALPATFSKMVHLCQEKKWEEAKEIHHALRPTIKLLFADGNPGGVKAALHIMGKIENELRLPLVPVSEPVYEKLKEEISKLDR